MSSLPPRLKARADRVDKHCDLAELLEQYGYAIVAGAEREQQFSCDLHGVDRKPSARFYPATNSTYCWVCQKSRGPIAWTMDKEGVAFRQAIDLLERRFGLDPLPWNDDAQHETATSDEADETKRKYFALYRTLSHALQQETNERDIDCSRLLAFWEAFDRVSYMVSRSMTSYSDGTLAFQRVRMSLLRELEKRSDV